MVFTTKKKDIVRYVMEFIISKAIVLFLFDISFTKTMSYFHLNTAVLTI